MCWGGFAKEFRELVGNVNGSTAIKQFYRQLVFFLSSKMFFTIAVQVTVVEYSHIGFPLFLPLLRRWTIIHRKMYFVAVWTTVIYKLLYCLCPLYVISCTVSSLLTYPFFLGGGGRSGAEQHHLRKTNTTLADFPIHTPPPPPHLLFVSGEFLRLL